jgi:hypothetical protein
MNDTWTPKVGDRVRCADCGEVGELTGHMECPYPRDHDS